MLNIVCWNINSIRSRLEQLFLLIQNENPDVILLQEIKCTKENFPFLEIEDLGYNCYVYGQKSYNGVAILSKYNCDDVVCGIPGFEDEQARYIEAVISVFGGAIRIASVYVPNGQSIGSDKFEYKLNFLNALSGHLKNLYNLQESALIAGDYNIAPDGMDVYDVEKLTGTIGFHHTERERLNSIINVGFYDAFRVKYPNKIEFSWWDYRASSVANNLGMRIDLVLTSPEAMDMVQDIEILKRYREMPKPSDHAPILVSLNGG
jgi:exodeoxyribonuclease-3